MAFTPAAYQPDKHAPQEDNDDAEPMTQGQKAYVADLHKFLLQVAEGTYYNYPAQPEAQTYAKKVIEQVVSRLNVLNLQSMTELPNSKASATIDWLKAHKLKAQQLQRASLARQRDADAIARRRAHEQQLQATRPVPAPLVEGIHDLGDGKVYKVQRNHYAGPPFKVKVLDPTSHFRTATGRHKFNVLSRFQLSGLRADNPTHLTEATLMSKENAIEWGKLYGFCVRCGRILEVEESIEQGIGPVCINKF